MRVVLLLLVLVAATGVAVAALVVSRVRGAREPAPVIVALGDSITEGAAAGGVRWTDVLAQRLGPTGPVTVINRGIGGNRLLRDGAGPAGLARFDREVVAQRGARWVIVLIGINDLGFPGSLDPAAVPVTAEQLLDGYRQLIQRAHAASLRIYGGTLLPFEGAGSGFDNPEKERVRAAVNGWLRTSGAFDAVIDFDLALRDPAHPARLLPAFDSGDHLHPGAAGQRAMGDAIDLALFRTAR